MPEEMGKKKKMNWSVGCLKLQAPIENRFVIQNHDKFQLHRMYPNFSVNVTTYRLSDFVTFSQLTDWLYLFKYFIMASYSRRQSHQQFQDKIVIQPERRRRRKMTNAKIKEKLTKLTRMEPISLMNDNIQVGASFIMFMFILPEYRLHVINRNKDFSAWLAK